MAMNYRELGKRHQEKYPVGVRKMNDLAEKLVRQGQLPEEFQQTSVTSAPHIEAVQTPLSVETQRLIEQMRGDGYAVYETSGKTPRSLRDEEMRYWYLNPGLEDLTAQPALLAFKKDPSEFYLRGSENIPYEDQLELIPQEQHEVDREYPDAGLVVRVGHFPEWTELALKHFKETGVRVHGKDFGYNYTWTDTYESKKQGADRAIAGSWGETNGFDGDFWEPDDVNPGLCLAPLVVIPRK